LQERPQRPVRGSLVERRYRLRTFANELVKLAPDVILANGTPVIAMSADDSATLQSGNGCAAGRPYAAPVKAEIVRH
jgi:hypothetical protein